MKWQGFRSISKRRRFAAILGMTSVLALVVAQLALADAPDPVLPLTGSAVQNADSSHTLTVSGNWVWTTHKSDCNKDRFAVGWAIDWDDPTQPGNLVGSAQGVSVDVGAASANSYNPADNFVHHYTTTPRCGTFDPAKGYNSGAWGPESHTYPPSVKEVAVCVITYDIHGKDAPSGTKETTAGGNDHNQDNSVQKNENTPLGNGCFTTEFKFDAPEIALEKDGPATAVRGTTITYTFKATNPGNVPLSNVTLTDPRCDAGTISAPTKTGNGDNLLDPGEVWTFTCTHLITNSDPDPLPNTGTITGTPPHGDNVTDTDDHIVDLEAPPVPVVDIEKSGPSEATVGDTITYTLDVSIPSGNVPLTNVTVTDPRCDAGTLSGPTKTQGDADDTLEAGELWIYTCTHEITSSDPNPLPNTATVTGTGPNNETVTDQDSHLVTVNAAPAIKIDKSGPNAAKVGDTITYTLEVSVPVDTELTDIKVTDTKCDNDPKLKNKLGGDNDDVLEFGEVWVYECTHKATDADIGNLKNVAEVKGTDRTGKKVTDRDDHVVEIEKVLPKPPITPPPPQGPLPFTGFETTDALLLALGLLLAGAGAMWLSRKDANRI